MQDSTSTHSYVVVTMYNTQRGRGINQSEIILP